MANSLFGKLDELLKNILKIKNTTTDSKIELDTVQNSVNITKNNTVTLQNSVNVLQDTTSNIGDILRDYPVHYGTFDNVQSVIGQKYFRVCHLDSWRNKYIMTPTDLSHNYIYIAIDSHVAKNVFINSVLINGTIIAAMQSLGREGDFDVWKSTLTLEDLNITKLDPIVVEVL